MTKSKPVIRHSAAVHLDNVRKKFGTFTALRSVSFDIGDNEFFTLLGPSGCGKTTLLRMIAGFETPTSGEIYLYGDEIETLPPNKRPVNTVFQNYALFPHMTVRENVGFGLRMLKWRAPEAAERTEAMLKLVKLDAFADRKPAQLSGGQQQRVALARAMAPRPKVLLLDEPLSALDLKLRQEMRSELKLLQKETGITFIFVTHDQEEALTMSDRIAVMSSGEVQQIGTATEIYETPVNRFVADFIGETNLLDVTVTGSDEGRVSCTLDSGAALIAEGQANPVPGSRGHVSIRPEKLRFVPEAEAAPGLTGTLLRRVYLGTDTQNIVQLDNGPEVSIRAQNSTGGLVGLNEGDRTGIGIADHAVRFLMD